MSEVKTKQFWIEDDDYAKPHLFVFHSDHLAAMEAKDREIEGLMRLIEDLEKTSGFVCVGERYDHRTGKDVSIWEKRQ